MLHASLTVLATGLVLLASGWKAPEPQNPELHDRMTAVKEHLKSTAQLVMGGGDLDEAAGLASDAQAVLMSCKAIRPVSIAADDAAGMRRYRAAMADAIAQFAMLEAELHRGERALAQSRIRGPLFDLRNRSHEAFQ